VADQSVTVIIIINNVLI